MSGKMKGLIGGGVALLALVLILVFTLGGKEDPVRELGEKYLSLCETFYEDAKNVNNKNDVKKVYKDFLSGILQHIPELLVVLKEDVEKNYGGDWDKAMKDEKMPEEYKDLEEGFKAFAKNMESLELDSEYAEKMEKIRLDFNQDDIKSFLTEVRFARDHNLATVELSPDDVSRLIKGDLPLDITVKKSLLN